MHLATLVLYRVDRMGPFHNRYPYGDFELAIAGPLATPLAQEVTHSVEHLHAMVIGVSHVNPSIAIHLNLPGVQELAIATAVGAPLAQEVTRSVEHLHTVVKGIGHVHPSGPIHLYPLGFIELAIAGARRAPFTQEIAVGVKHLDTVIPTIGHIHHPIIHPLSHQGREAGRRRRPVCPICAGSCRRRQTPAHGYFPTPPRTHTRTRLSLSLCLH